MQPFDDSLTHWVIGVAAAAGVAVIGFLSRWTFRGIVDQMREIATDVHTVTTLATSQATAIALLQKDNGQLQQAVANLERRIEGQAEFYRAQHDQTRKDFHMWKNEISKEIMHSVRARDRADD